MRNRPRLLSLPATILLLAVAGCSFTYLYRQLDWMVPWYVSDYITLDAQQQSELEKRLLGQLDWHCSTQLRRYAHWFRQLHDDPDAFSREQLARDYETTRAFWHDLMIRVSKDATPILASATDAQVDELLANLERERREREREYAELTPGERSQQRVERMSRLLERWMGELGPRQHQQVMAWSKALSQGGNDAWLENRRRWQARLTAAMAQRKNSRLFSRRLHTLLVEPETLWHDEYRREFVRRKDLTLDMLATVAGAMTPVQRSHLEYELLSWAEDFDSLACEAEKRPHVTHQ